MSRSVGVLLVGSCLLLAGCGGDDEAAAEEKTASSASPSPSSGPTFDPVVDGVPTGKWVYRTRTVKSSDPDWFKVGAKQRSTWTFPSTCSGPETCDGEVTSSSGFPKDFSWDGRSLTITRAPDKPVSATCVDVATGREVPGSKVWFHFEYGPQRFEPSGPVADAAPTKFTGRLVITVKIDRWNQACDLLPEYQDDERATEQSTLTLAQ